MADTQGLTMSARPAGEQVGQAQPDKSSMSRSIPKPIISKSLCQKAYKSNEQLTKLERLLIFSRCDVPGKALAHPTTITEAERNEILGRPPPALLASSIRAMTKNAMSTIAELVADQGRSLDWIGSLAAMDSFWSRETRSLQGIQPPWYYSAANNAAKRLHELPGERALHLEIGRRLGDPDINAELLAKTGKMDPISGRLMLTKVKDSPELASAQQERLTSFASQMNRTRLEISVRVLAELESLSDVERDEMRELRERERIQYEKEVADDAREAERKAAARKREMEAADEDAKEEIRRRRRRKRAILKAKYGDADYSDSDSDTIDRDEGEFPTSEDTY